MTNHHPRNRTPTTTDQQLGASANRPKPGIRWSAVVFAFAGNLLFFTLANTAAGMAAGSEHALLWASILGPALAGVLTAIVARHRGGIHAFLGGAATLPVIALLLLPGAWQTAIFAAGFCTLGGAITELFMRQRPRDAI